MYYNMKRTKIIRRFMRLFRRNFLRAKKKYVYLFTEGNAKMRELLGQTEPDKARLRIDDSHR